MPGLTRASIETSTSSKGMDCRVKPGNDDRWRVSMAEAKSAPGWAGALNVPSGEGASSVAKARCAGYLFPMRQAFGDDLRGFQRRLAQGRVFDDLALPASGHALQPARQ